MKLADLRARQRARHLVLPSAYTEPPTLSEALIDRLHWLFVRTYGFKPLTGSREARHLEALAHLGFVTSCDGHYVISDAGRELLGLRMRKPKT